MSRTLLLALLLSAAAPFSFAQGLPKFPQQNHVTTDTHVKNFWTRTLRWQARSTRNHLLRSDKNLLVERIDAGLYDDLAELAAHRSNLAFLEFKNRFVAAQKLRQKIAALEQDPLIARVAMDVRPAPVVAGPAPAQGPAPAPHLGDPEHLQETELEYLHYSVEEDSPDCPPHETRRRHRTPLHPAQTDARAPGPLTHLPRTKPTPQAVARPRRLTTGSLSPARSRSNRAAQTRPSTHTTPTPRLSPQTGNHPSRAHSTRSPVRVASPASPRPRPQSSPSPRPSSSPSPTPSRPASRPAPSRPTISGSGVSNSFRGARTR